VENSLGRLWLLNRPASKLAAQMDYYIAPEEPETDFLRITRPEDIRICDPAAGSGHMLTYAFDLLHAIYEEEGYEPTEIPALILTHNLHGVEIDDRAGALAAFALVMKAAAKLGRRRFLRLGVQPNICVMQDVRFTPAEMQDVAAVVGRDLFTADLRETLGQFEQAKNFGSLIVPKLRDPAEVARVVRSRDFGGDLLLRDVQERVLKVLEMAEALSPKYHVVVANPPYMGGGGMDGKTGAWLKERYPDSRSDLMTCFMERSGDLVRANGIWGMINLPSWMFLSSFDKLRGKLIAGSDLQSLIHLGRGIFGADFGSVAFVVRAAKSERGRHGSYRRLFNKASIVRSPEEIESLFQDRSFGCFSTSQYQFSKIPGQPIAYWLSEAVFNSFAKLPSLYSVAPTKQGLATGDNERFLRAWPEVSKNRTAFDIKSSEETLQREERWFPCNKGGEFRKWYGNNMIVADWHHGGHTIKAFTDENGKLRSRPQNEAFYFKSGLTWSAISISSLSMRLSPVGAMFETKGAMCFPVESNLSRVLAFSNTKIVNRLLLALSPTLDFHEGPVGRLPYSDAAGADALSTSCVALARTDWDAFETSWDFTTLPLLAPEHRDQTLAASYAALRAHWQGMTDEVQRLEEENNRIFIDAYGLQDELTPEVPLEEITLTCNPAYRYGGKATEAELEARLLSDTMAEFLHYAVGCMFGRYSLDAPGLILANQGEGLADYLARIPEPSFDVDGDNVIPMLDGDWFADDITERFRKFLRVTFGEAQFQENLAFIEAALGKDIRKYFTKDFFEAHVRRYKKRPIYWMFSSPKGTFNALIYMHRYRPDTVSVVLNDYLREFISKLQSERLRLEKLADDMNASQSQRTKAQKDVAVVAKQIEELTVWERDVVFPLAQAKIEIDLDDGVKANYPKFGAALKFIKGLEASEDE
jgi:type II restriction/modification system DNA methylase subunit YeeA